MELNFLDWMSVVLFLILSLFIGLIFTRRAGKSMQDFFLGGRSLPWYIAGISMVATTFAADTPLLVTELVRGKGISGNWLWWNMCIGGMLTTFFFAPLWRRSGVVTELEFIEFRYRGPAAAFLRGFKSVYLGVFLNSVIIGWVNVAMATILQVFFNLSYESSVWLIAGLMFITFLYSSLSGLLGVAYTDAFQFIIAMTGTTILAFVVLSSDDIGGISGLLEKVPSDTLRLLPSLSNAEDSSGMVLSISLLAFISFIGVQWWASWYPGAEPGGGGYVAQRMMSAKNEKHAMLATLFFNIAHYCIRPWPWIIVALATMVLYPSLASAEEFREGYVMAIRDHMPLGLKGLLLAAFLGAYMSTISTQLNWGAGFLANDLYKRFIAKGRSEKHYVMIARLATFVIMGASVTATIYIKTIEDAWNFLIQGGAGLGMVLMLRWFWPRINAWSELSATIAPLVGYAILRNYTDDGTQILLINAGFTTVVWLCVTWLTPPEKQEVLRAFYDKVQPNIGWKKFRQEKLSQPVWPLFVCWFTAVCMTYGILFSTGYLIFMQFMEAALCLGFTLVNLFLLLWAYKKVSLAEY